MKKRVLILALLLLLLVPVMPAQAAYGDESPESITSFAETLPDDTAFWFDNESYEGTGYAESFADVSDWSGDGLEAGDSFSSDGDIVSLKFAYQGSASTDLMVSNGIGPFPQTYYYEFRWRVNATYAGTGARIYLWLRDSDTDRLQWYTNPTTANTWYTQKGIISGMTVVGNPVGDIVGADFAAYCPDSGDAVKFDIDYLRISPSDELGWQHDGSETKGITPSAGDTVSTDGDILTLDTDVTEGTFEFVFDTTATASAISCTYYPFLALNCTDITTGDGWKLQQFDGSNWATLQATTVYNPVGGTWTPAVYRYNMRALDTTVTKLRFNLTATALVKLDWIKVYSIANFTLSLDSDLETTDYAYVQDSAIVFHRTTSWPDYINLGYDPALSVDTAIYTVGNVTYSNPSVSGQDWSITFSGETGTPTRYDDEGVMFLFAGGTLTDFVFATYDSFTLSAIKFIDGRNWHELPDAFLWLDLLTANLNTGWFVLAGMVIVAGSGLYLVKGGRKEASMNKVFFFLVLFMLGWGLIIGGIAP